MKNQNQVGKLGIQFSLFGIAWLQIIIFMAEMVIRTEVNSTGWGRRIVAPATARTEHFEIKCVKYQSCRAVSRVLSRKDKGLRADGDEQRPI